MDDPEWKYDEVPEIMDGKNIADFIDADLEKKLAELEHEEEMLMLGRNITEMDIDEINPDLLEAKKQIDSKRALKKIEHRMKANKKAFPRHMELADFEQDLGKSGKDTSAVREKFRKRTKPRPLTSVYAKEANAMDEEEKVDGDGIFGNERGTQRKIEKKLRTFSRSRSKGTKRELSANEKVKSFMYKNINWFL